VNEQAIVSETSKRSLYLNLLFINIIGKKEINATNKESGKLEIIHRVTVGENVKRIAIPKPRYDWCNFFPSK
jgi:hypothetical protein